MVTLLSVVTGINAMPYSQAKEEALFLTDKMAYELNLSEQQYEAAYEINLDYLMSLDNADDLYGRYWTYRNTDLSYILLDWQYRAFIEASYFYRPVYWSAGFWHFGIYAHYPHRTHFYFSRPACYVSYRGGHSWRHNGGVSWYHNRSHVYVGHTRHVGMRETYRTYNRGGVRSNVVTGRDTRRDDMYRHSGSTRNQSTSRYEGTTHREPLRSTGGSSMSGNRDYNRNNSIGESRRPSSTRITVDHNNSSSRPSMSGSSRPSMSGSSSRPSMGSSSHSSMSGSSRGTSGSGFSRGGNNGARR